jgi:hypothetical protein
MLIAMVAVIVAIFGALVYLLFSPSAPPGSHGPQIAELGRLAYFAAMIGLMVTFAAKVIRLLN